MFYHCPNVTAFEISENYSPFWYILDSGIQNNQTLNSWQIINYMGLSSA